MVLALGSRSFFTFVEMAGPFWGRGYPVGSGLVVVLVSIYESWNLDC